jgi:hypothetical protein
MKIAIFGASAPLGILADRGLWVSDASYDAAAPLTPVDRFVEPFMDPFARSVLRALAAGDLDPFGAVIFLRESPGAVHAYQYARELTRRGVIGAGAPLMILLNLIPSDSPAARAFNLSELDRVETALRDIGWSPNAPRAPEAALHRLMAMQAQGLLSGAEGFARRLSLTRDGVCDLSPAPVDAGPRLALLGAPMGGNGLHAALDRIGTLVFDQQAADQAQAAATTLENYAANPWAPRQPLPLYIAALRTALTDHQVERVFWQVDQNDDLWGWLLPQVRELCADLGVCFTDLGFLPRWPNRPDLQIEGLA